MPDPSGNEKYAALVARYRASLPDKAARVRSLSEDAAAAGYSAEALAAVADYCHQLAGSAAVYGLQELSERLVDTERRIVDLGAGHVDAGQRARDISPLIDAVLAACEAGR